jgi:hypothetical protein
MRYFLSAIALMTVFLAAPARADDSALIRALGDRYSALRLAMDERLIGKVREMLAPGFRSVSLSGRTEDASQMLKLLEKAGAEHPHVATTGVKVLKDEGEKATVAQTYEMHAVKMGRGGGQDRVKIIALSTDVWVKKDSQWLLESTETESADLYINDKLEKHAVREKKTEAPSGSPAP